MLTQRGTSLPVFYKTPPQRHITTPEGGSFLKAGLHLPHWRKFSHHSSSLTFISAYQLFWRLEIDFVASQWSGTIQASTHSKFSLHNWLRSPQIFQGLIFVFLFSTLISTSPPFPCLGNQKNVLNMFVYMFIWICCL